MRDGMVDREKIIEHITDCVRIADCQINHNWVFVRTDILKDALVLLKSSFTPQQVYDTVIEHAHHDKRFKLGDKIDYSFIDVVDILNMELMCKAGDV